jgi:arginine N-succinyltransferase
MLVARAIRQQDLDGLLALARETGDGMTTLKADAHMLAARIELACASFAGTIAPELRDYVFVLEDTSTQQIVGVSAIKAAVGLDAPFYNYRIGTLVHSSAELQVFSRMETLYLSNDLTGSAELCSLFLHPAYRNGNNGRLLSKCRLLFIAQFPQLFGARLIAELRGFLQEDGRSPFWDSLGRHFFKMDFNRADDITALGKKSFIAELMPRYPLYVALLPEPAQAVIGQVHVDTAPARRLLEQEGMHFEGYVDIFDAGPVLQARISELRALRESRLAVIAAATDTMPVNPRVMLVASTGLADFRSLVLEADPHHGQIVIDAQAQALLHTDAGAALRIMSLNPKKRAHG